MTYAPRTFCPRKLARGMVKRYMGQGPLIGYMIGCPSCGFIELHLQEKVGFIEEPADGSRLTEPDPKGVRHPVTTKLVQTGMPARCTYCGRHIIIGFDMVHARA